MSAFSAAGSAVCQVCRSCSGKVRFNFANIVVLDARLLCYRLLKTSSILPTTARRANNDADWTKFHVVKVRQVSSERFDDESAQRCG